jgi:hypothetical protein
MTRASTTGSATWSPSTPSWYAASARNHADGGDSLQDTIYVRTADM